MRILVVGVGGLGCPAAMIFSRAGISTLRLCDDDIVEESNLPRQILFDESSIGKNKLAEAKRVLEKNANVKIETTKARFLPKHAREILDGCDLVFEGADNFATKFLVADACAIAKIPVVHASAVKMRGTAFAGCYRCLFEDIPTGRAPNCADDGVLGPMVGVVAALAADLALAILRGKPNIHGTLVTYDATTDILRRTQISTRKDCEHTRIDDLDERRYIG